MLFLKPDVKKNREIFFHCLFCYTGYSPPVTSYLTWVSTFRPKYKFRSICMESLDHNWANISETICPEKLVFGK